MVKQYDFAERDNLSDVGTKVIINYLNQQAETDEVKDVSNKEEFREMDIDILWHKKDGTLRKIEIKIDEKMNQTGNFFLETVSNDVKNTPGCFLYSKADDFYYYDVINDVLYIFDLTEARAWFKKHLYNFRETATSTINQSGERLYRTIGRLVPKDILIENVKVRIIKNIKKMV